MQKNSCRITKNSTQINNYNNSNSCLMITIDNYLDAHYIHRSNWLRAAVLGANDGIISISSLAIGVAAAGATRDSIVLATVAGLVAGALSMAAGEYVSVSSQTDIEKADIERERQELVTASAPASRRSRKCCSVRPRP